MQKILFSNTVSSENNSSTNSLINQYTEVEKKINYLDLIGIEEFIELTIRKEILADNSFNFSYSNTEKFISDYIANKSVKVFVPENQYFSKEFNVPLNKIVNNTETMSLAEDIFYYPNQYPNGLDLPPLEEVPDYYVCTGNKCDYFSPLYGLIQQDQFSDFFNLEF
ncbi:MAG: hypothetical protein ACK4OM_06055 [Alphaproteobacteria bacterium]